MAPAGLQNAIFGLGLGLLRMTKKHTPQDGNLPRKNWVNSNEIVHVPAYSFKKVTNFLQQNLDRQPGYDEFRRG